MNNLKLISAIALLGILLFSACEKEDELNQTSENITQSSFKKELSKSNLNNKSSCIECNIDNPFDSVGVIHNQIMAQIISLVQDDDNLNRIMYLQDSLITDRYGATISPFILNGVETTHIYNETLDDYYKSEINSSTLISQQNKIYLNELIDIATTNQGSISDLMDNIKSFESNLMDNNNSQDIQIVLIASSVMRHSVEFWVEEYPSRPFWQWLVVGVCDVAGGVAGGSAGVPGGPVVVVAGSIAGAVGASASAAALIDFFCGDNCS